MASPVFRDDVRGDWTPQYQQHGKEKQGGVLIVGMSVDRPWCPQHCCVRLQSRLVASLHLPQQFFTFVVVFRKDTNL
jgi:hypothetical protein